MRSQVQFFHTDFTDKTLTFFLFEDAEINKYVLDGSSGVLPTPTMLLDLQTTIKKQIMVRLKNLNYFVLFPEKETIRLLGST
jgi:hypothetical protein